MLTTHCCIQMGHAIINPHSSLQSLSLTSHPTYQAPLLHMSRLHHHCPQLWAAWPQLQSPLLTTPGPISLLLLIRVCGIRGQQLLSPQLLMSSHGMTWQQPQNLLPCHLLSQRLAQLQSPLMALRVEAKAKNQVGKMAYLQQVVTLHLRTQYLDHGIFPYCGFAPTFPFLTHG